MAARIIAVVFILALVNGSTGYAQVFFDAETGVVFPGSYNNIRQPVNEGTDYNAFGPDFTTNPVLNLRGRLGYTFLNRHTLFVTYAPLTIESVSKQPLTQPVRFEDITIPAGRVLTTRYKFNGYRLTYRYSLVRSDKFRLGVGATVNMRDAYIRASDGTQSRQFSNVGLVALLSLYANYQPGKVGFLLEGDAFAVKQGRIEDVFGGITYAFRPKTKLRLGYRIVEGGADGDTFYNFTRFNVAAVGIQIGL